MLVFFIDPIVDFDLLWYTFIRLGTCCSFGLKMCASHIDEQRYIAYWLSTSEMVTSGFTYMYPAGATANVKRGIRQQAAMFVLREVLSSNRYGE